MLGCGSGTLKVTRIAASAERPANVVVYLSVADKLGRPLGGLDVGNFRVYEDGKLIPEGKAKRAMLDTDLAIARDALLLVDLSGPIADSEYLPDLAKSVGAFLDKVGASEKVAISAFDGSDEVAPFVGFGATIDTAKVVDAIRNYKPRNRKTNLNGAVFQGLGALKEQLGQETAPQKVSTLVVFTDRGDLSHSVNAQTLEQALADSPASIYVIGVGEGVSRDELAPIGRNGIFISKDPKAFKKGFEEVIDKLATIADGRYIFSYCTAKRRGEHELKLEVAVPGDKGRLFYHFSAAGFRSGCTPTRKPTLSALPDS